MGILDRLLSSPYPFISDGGMETDLIFHEGAEMPLFASFVLLDSPEGREMLRRYAVSYFELAQAASRGFVMGTPTWRANCGWGPKLGLDDAGIRDVNRRAIAFARDLRGAHPWRDHILIEGVLGPAGDGYAPDQLLTPTKRPACTAPSWRPLPRKVWTLRRLSQSPIQVKPSAWSTAGATLACL